jgi:ribose transport system substrate-binding protein
VKVVYFVPDTDNPFWKEIVAGVTKTGQSAGIHLELVSAQRRSDLQATQVADFQARKPEAVLITPLNPKSVSAGCRAILKSGLPLISIDQNLGTDASASVLSGNMKGGIMAAAFIAQRVGSGGRIVRIRAEDGLESVSLRTSSFSDEAKRSGLQLVRDLVANSNRNQAYKVMLDFVRRGEGFDAVFAENDTMALGAVEALNYTRAKPWPVVVGYDGIPEALQSIRKAELAATIGQDPFALGETAASVLAQVISRQPYKKLTMLLPELIDKANAEIFEARKSAG